ncbi:MAG: IS630 family transposase [Ignavibacteriae bacterium]|nr:MAG: IS630 family transposase [Chlorobiota bacterium]MBE7475767.1 IS630 family transposase [Ignavibacteriales bacterium]MBL1122928.1 IS630 family transposase [Ignavibacteriota bacterium]MCE7858135.1 IS630 family transposase [Ignavibacteria bacterium CHB3]
MKTKPIKLNEKEREALTTISRSQKAENRIVTRAKIILHSTEANTYETIMQLTKQSRGSVAKWRRRFIEHRLNGLKDLPRSGKPKVITAEQEAKVIEKACSKAEDGYTNWSQRRIAKEVGISQTKVQNILSQADLKPHKTDYWCGKSPDPEFETKMTEIVGLYINPPENALVLCVDEKTQIQALDRTQPELPMISGNAKRQTTTYKRNGVVSLIAALSVHQGEITAKPIKTNNAINFLGFLKSLEKKYSKKDLHIIVDNLSIHKHKNVKQWLSKKENIKIHYTPTYSSWLNQIEIWFNILTKDVLKGGIWKSKQQLIRQIIDYIKTYNSTRAKPFQWTYTGKVLKL